MLHGDARLLASQDRRKLVDCAQLALDTRDPFETLGVLRRLEQIDLVEDQPVGEGHLLDRLVLRPLGLLLIEVLLDVESVDHCDDAVEARKLLNRLVHEEGLGDRARVRQARRLDDDRVEFRTPPKELCEYADEVAAHRATDAAVIHLEDVLGGVEAFTHQRIVHAHLAKLILDHRNLLAMVRRQDVVEQCRLARACVDDRHAALI